MKSRAAFCSIPEASGTSSRRSKRTSCGVGFSCLESAAPLAQECVVRALALLTGDAPGVPRKFVRVLGRTASRTLEWLVGEVRKLPPELHPVVQALWCEQRFRAMAITSAPEETAGGHQS